MDKYDKAIAYLKKHPKEINRVWFTPYDHEHGCLFKFMGKDDSDADIPNERCGCLIMIKNNTFYKSFDSKLTEEIRADKNIPCRSELITVESLPIFAKYQRKADKLREKLKSKSCSTKS